ncbi:hypothetical protein CONPUDRAFT_110124 [Coniophora puteana RWD-64-598 SS2]|uniref:Ribonucleases P/MRP subunit Pop8-like domain-containing protein n=1 Tax=Coniophora puteana (strain RWD-64-598) TaxID=741705 RepID=A0A5M3MBF1_CONPW|nr:uncharacterized protein CONPUDRAFT_110124 [Coniophora puteana RWD-64-598 SS2]EIW76568.1 hypothetical protein CONPUDRAFT_110124 [Coniophora puteana RWD-64-598 SS2]
MPRPISTSTHYVALALKPANHDELLIRKALQDALTPMFGLTFANMHLDILTISEDGEGMIIRTGSRSDAQKLIAAIVASQGPLRFSLKKDSPFLPSLVASQGII